jgi:hypothetical protein
VALSIAKGTAGAAAGAVTGALGARCSEVSIDDELRVAAITASTMLITTNMVARIAVERVRKSAAPRADIRPEGLPPVVKPPPSDFCMRITVTRRAAMMAWMTSRN